MIRINSQIRVDDARTQVEGRRLVFLRLGHL